MACHRAGPVPMPQPVHGRLAPADLGRKLSVRPGRVPKGHRSVRRRGPNLARTPAQGVAGPPCERVAGRSTQKGYTG